MRSISKVRTVKGGRRGSFRRSMVLVLHGTKQTHREQCTHREGRAAGVIQAQHICAAQPGGGQGTAQQVSTVVLHREAAGESGLWLAA